MDSSNSSSNNGDNNNTLCRDYIKGSCHNNDCKKLHVKDGCRFWLLAGQCKFNSSCHFKHTKIVCNGPCQNISCRKLHVVSKNNNSRNNNSNNNVNNNKNSNKNSNNNSTSGGGSNNNNKNNNISSGEVSSSPVRLTPGSSFTRNQPINDQLLAFYQDVSKGNIKEIQHPNVSISNDQEEDINVLLRAFQETHINDNDGNTIAGSKRSNDKDNNNSSNKTAKQGLHNLDILIGICPTMRSKLLYKLKDKQSKKNIDNEVITLEKLKYIDYLCRNEPSPKPKFNCTYVHHNYHPVAWKDMYEVWKKTTVKGKSVVDTRFSKGGFKTEIEAEHFAWRNIFTNIDAISHGQQAIEYTLNSCLNEKDPRRLPNLSGLEPNDADREFRKIRVHCFDPNRRAYTNMGYFVTIRPIEESLAIVKLPEDCYLISKQNNSMDQINKAYNNLVGFISALQTEQLINVDNEKAAMIIDGDDNISEALEYDNDNSNKVSGNQDDESPDFNEYKNRRSNIVIRNLFQLWSDGLKDPDLHNLASKRIEFISDIWFPSYIKYAMDDQKKHRMNVLVGEDLSTIEGSFNKTRKLDEYKVIRKNYDPHGIFVNDLTPMIEEALRSATSSIKIIMYRLNSIKVVAILKDIWSKNKTIKIQMILDNNSNQDNLDIWIDFLTYAANVILADRKDNNGTSSYEYPDIRLTIGILIYHTKLFLIDGNIISNFGSANMTRYGQTLNKEFSRESKDQSTNDCWLSLFEEEFARFNSDICNYWYNFIERNCIENAQNWKIFLDVAPYILEKYPNIGYYVMLFQKLQDSHNITFWGKFVPVGKPTPRYIAALIFEQAKWEEVDTLVRLFNQSYTGTVSNISKADILKLNKLSIDSKWHDQESNSVKVAKDNGVILATPEEWQRINKCFYEAIHHILLFTIALGIEWAELLIELMESNIRNNKDVLVIVIVWKLPSAVRDEYIVSLIELGAIILQVESGVQHHKCIIVDGNIISNGGCANLSWGAFSGGAGRGNQGEYDICIAHDHSQLEVFSMIVVAILAFEEVAAKLLIKKR